MKPILLFLILSNLLLACTAPQNKGNTRNQVSILLNGEEEHTFLVQYDIDLYSNEGESYRDFYKFSLFTEGKLFPKHRMWFEIMTQHPLKLGKNSLGATNIFSHHAKNYYVYDDKITGELLITKLEKGIISGSFELEITDIQQLSIDGKKVAKALVKGDFEEVKIRHGNYFE